MCFKRIKMFILILKRLVVYLVNAVKSLCKLQQKTLIFHHQKLEILQQFIEVNCRITHANRAKNIFNMNKFYTVCQIPLAYFWRGILLAINHRIVSLTNNYILLYQHFEKYFSWIWCYFNYRIFYRASFCEE